MVSNFQNLTYADREKIECSLHHPRLTLSGNTPPTDLLQHIPHDAPRADVLSLGCGDLRDLLYSILLHGRRQRTLSFVLNDWEPAIHARNLVFLQMILDSRNLLAECGYAAEIKEAIGELDTVCFQCNDAVDESENSKEPSAANPSKAKTNPRAAFASRIGVIFR